MDEQVQVVKDSGLRLSDIHVDHIDPNPNNSNEMDDDTFSRLCEEVRENGFLSPITVIENPDGRYRIMSGEHRWKAAIATDHQYIPAIILSDEKWNDTDIIDLVGIRMNEIRGRASAEKLRPVYERVVAKHGEESAQKIMGITHNEVFRRLVRKMAKNIQKTMTPEMAKEVEAAADKAKDPVQFGKSLAKILQAQAKHMESNCMVFQGGVKQHALVKCSPDFFAVVSELVGYVQKYGEDINDVLFSSLLTLLKSYQERVKTDPPPEDIASEN